MYMDLNIYIINIFDLYNKVTKCKKDRKGGLYQVHCSIPRSH